MGPIPKLTRVYLASGDEFTVPEFTVTVSEWMEDGHGVIWTENIRWRNPDGDEADHFADYPWYTCEPLALRSDQIVGAERVEEHIAKVIDRAREHNDE